MQLSLAARRALAGAAAALALVAGARAASSDGEVTLRGAYYKERSTRVTQPMMDARFDVGEDGELDAHVLLDSISSASIAAGAAGQSFNENRFELGATYLHRLGNLRFGGGTRLSSEPDYQSGFVHLRGEVELADRNTTIGLNLAGGRDAVSNEGAQGGINVEQIDGRALHEHGLGVAVAGAVPRADRPGDLRPQSTSTASRRTRTARSRPAAASSGSGCRRRAPATPPRPRCAASCRSRGRL